ncbi:Acyl-lipid (9-3)-desaturase [Porphyridium purpureum]|uniref:Acyl-lipid (9-3)-desaturase n=1 Tax=Porphyridium purpureum TaxID=35688 RepID=A0A5J4YSF5_PORPP|nr:Acyl-lipid (9-3)-desaturase [Porphyridium purpureum]|eukprot:POR6493..scf227_4
MAPNVDSGSKDRGVSAVKEVVSGATANALSPAERVVTRKELAGHASRESVWIAVNGRVYDVTGFENVHPGGEIILTAAGQDATDVFAAFHTPATWKMMPQFLVGNLEEDALSAKPSKQLNGHSPHEYQADIRKMRAELVKLRAFDSNKFFYLFKFLSTSAICALSVVMALGMKDSMIVTALAAFTMALFWQQCGWLAHDFLHHQVFKNRVFNNLVGLVVGNVYQGFSVSWWKMKHNHHHAAPNVTSTAAGPDPDIDTVPVLLWSEKLIEGDSKEMEDLPMFLMKNQKIFYWPVLCVARISWLLQSLLFQRAPVWNFVGGNSWRAVEIVALLMHHGAYFYLLSLLKSWVHVALFLVVSQAMGGVLLGVVFTVGHNAMKVLSEEEMKSTDFVQMQVLTTRNIEPTAFNRWFSGGLSYQIEHHIWPQLPRHSLPKAREILTKFCSKYDIPYASQGLIEGNMEVWKMLSKLGESL